MKKRRKNFKKNKKNYKNSKLTLFQKSDPIPTYCEP